MPGVSDAIRRTKLQQDQQAHRKDMEQLVALVKEGRLHEADARQLEVLKMALELHKVLGEREKPSETSSDKEAIVAAVKAAVSEIVTNLPSAVVTSVGQVEDRARPRMKHTSLADFVHTDEEVSISHGDSLGQTKESEEDSGDKLEKLRKLKGGG